MLFETDFRFLIIIPARSRFCTSARTKDTQNHQQGLLPDQCNRSASPNRKRRRVGTTTRCQHCCIRRKVHPIYRLPQMSPNRLLAGLLTWRYFDFSVHYVVVCCPSEVAVHLALTLHCAPSKLSFLRLLHIWILVSVVTSTWRGSSCPVTVSVI